MNRGVHADNLALSNYKGHFYLCVHRKTNAFFGPLQGFQGVSQSCHMLQLCVERCSSVFPIYWYILIIISVRILHKSDETSLTVIRTAVSLTLK